MDLATALEGAQKRATQRWSYGWASFVSAVDAAVGGMGITSSGDKTAAVGCYVADGDAAAAALALQTLHGALATRALDSIGGAASNYAPDLTPYTGTIGETEVGVAIAAVVAAKWGELWSAFCAALPVAGRYLGAPSSLELASALDLYLNEDTAETAAGELADLYEAFETAALGEAVELGQRSDPTIRTIAEV